MIITIFQIPLRTESEGNSNEHWTRKNQRHKKQKWIIKAAFMEKNLKINRPCEITLTRIAPRELDKEDNLPMSFKWIKDAIADYIIPGKASGRADDSKEISWKYDQKKGKVKEYSVEIRIEQRNC